MEQTNNTNIAQPARNENSINILYNKRMTLNTNIYIYNALINLN